MNKTIALFSVILAYVVGLNMGGAIDSELFIGVAGWCVLSIVLKTLSLLMGWIRENKEMDRKVMELDAHIREMFAECDRKHREYLSENSDLYYNRVQTARSVSFEERLQKRRQKTAYAA